MMSPRMPEQSAATRGDLLIWLALSGLLVATRGLLEQRMATQMLLQIPLLLGLGVRMSAYNAGVTSTPSRWNVQGAAGLLLSSATVATWMVPRMLDAAVEDWRIDLLKACMLIAAGWVARRSWRDATMIVQIFALGMAAWMTATVGMLLLNASNRLCVSYGFGDQQVTGYTLIGLTLVGVVAALVRVGVGGEKRAPVR